MAQRIILIGADRIGLDAVLARIKAQPDTSAVVLYPEANPLPEFSCMMLDRYIGRGIDFPENLRACGLDADKRQVRVRDNVSGSEDVMDYDLLIFASGSAPARLDVAGQFLGPVFRVGDFEDGARLRPKDEGNVVIGNGVNMLLAVSALLQNKAESVTIVPHDADPVTEPFSDTLTSMVQHHLAALGVTILDEPLTAIEGRHTIERIVAGSRTIEATRIINATTPLPVTELAAEAGIRVDGRGHILVNERLQTNFDTIFACGSCAAFVSTTCPEHVPGAAVKTTEPRQAAALAAALAGEKAQFNAPVQAWSIPLDDLTVAGAGLTPAAASACGFEVRTATVIQFDRAHFMPDAELMTLELVFDTTGRVLGIQGMGKSGDALSGRISAVSALLAAKPTVEDIANLEVAYSPPFASAMDVLNTVGNVAENILAGHNEGITPAEFDLLWKERESGECFFIDCREIGNAEPYIQKHPDHWNHISQAEIARRLDEVPTDKRVVLLCNTGARSYEAQITLKSAGFTDVVNVDGGVAAIKQSGVEV